MPVYRLSRKFIGSEHARKPIPRADPASPSLVLRVVFLASARLHFEAWIICEACSLELRDPLTSGS